MNRELPLMKWKRRNLFTIENRNFQKHAWQPDKIPGNLQKEKRNPFESISDYELKIEKKWSLSERLLERSHNSTEDLAWVVDNCVRSYSTSLKSFSPATWLILVLDLFLQGLSSLLETSSYACWHFATGSSRRYSKHLFSTKTTTQGSFFNLFYFIYFFILLHPFLPLSGYVSVVPPLTPTAVAASFGASFFLLLLALLSQALKVVIFMWCSPISTL